MKDKIKKKFKKLWGNRPFRTFIQGFIGVISGATLFELADINLLRALIISAIMAGLSAVMSLDKGEE